MSDRLNCCKKRGAVDADTKAEDYKRLQQYNRNLPLRGQRSPFVRSFNLPAYEQWHGDPLSLTPSWMTVFFPSTLKEFLGEARKRLIYNSSATLGLGFSRHEPSNVISETFPRRIF